MPTPHIAAPDGAFAPTVLAPGDPKRARYIADHHLDDAELITDVRAALGLSVPLYTNAAGDCTLQQHACRQARNGNSPQYANLEAHQQVDDEPAPQQGQGQAARAMAQRQHDGERALRYHHG